MNKQNKEVVNAFNETTKKYKNKSESEVLSDLKNTAKKNKEEGKLSDKNLDEF